METLLNNFIEIGILFSINDPATFAGLYAFITAPYG